MKSEGERGRYCPSAGHPPDARSSWMWIRSREPGAPSGSPEWAAGIQAPAGSGITRGAAGLQPGTPLPGATPASQEAARASTATRSSSCSAPCRTCARRPTAWTRGQTPSCCRLNAGPCAPAGPRGADHPGPALLPANKHPPAFPGPASLLWPPASAVPLLGAPGWALRGLAPSLLQPPLPVRHTPGRSLACLALRLGMETLAGSRRLLCDGWLGLGAPGRLSWWEGGGDEGS